jgi:WD40 repeat protein
MTCVPLNAYPNPFLAVTADGSSAAFVNTCGDVQVVNFAESTVRASWRPPARMNASALAFSGDGKLLVLGYASPDPRANVEVWEVARGRMVHRMAGHRGSVQAVEVSPDGLQVLSTGKDATLRVWEIANGRELARYGLLPGSGTDIAVSPRGNLSLVATGHRWSGGRWTLADSYGVQLWNMHDGRLVGRFETAGPIRAIALSPDGRHALSAGVDGSVNLWPMPCGPPVHDDACFRSADRVPVRVSAVP